jgi:UDP-GlcNAc3NAcA epimerase
LHRAENTDDEQRLRAIFSWLERMAKEQPIVMVVHPRTKKRLAVLGLEPKGLSLVDPLGYLDMARLVHHATAVFTDSGGLQKEAYFHRVPCVTLRDETEWVETVEAGWNRLWTVTDYRPRRDIEDYGTGNASQAIAKLLRQRLQR